MTLPTFTTCYCTNCGGHFPLSHFPCTPDPLFAEEDDGLDTVTQSM